ncbi:MAG: hypothetical protein A3205_08100 [Methanomassiliicoccales archaeon Mx-03]|nr:MAG: hypothetical protein A3205_08100 [Methanomassiliicoccales archaeon Mx-03]
MNRGVSAEAVLEVVDEVVLEVGGGLSRGEVLLPRIVAVSRAAEVVIRKTGPIQSKPMRGTVIMGTVKGDIHIIGKSLCCAMLRGAGYTVIDLGCDVTPDDFIDEAMVNHASIIGASSLMTTTLISQKDLVREVKSSGCRCRTIVGGAPCSQEWCDRIGADAYSATASEMVCIVGRMAAGRDRDHVRTDSIQWVDIRPCAISCL